MAGVLFGDRNLPIAPALAGRWARRQGGGRAEGQAANWRQSWCSGPALQG